uniref:Si:ch211-14i3.2 n=1 Tax=Oryzias sinensis TaxID=183150 RepID=A0A8C7YZ97_9TELE
MRNSPYFPFRVNVVLFIIGSLFRTSHFVDISDSVQINGGTDRNSYGRAASPQSSNDPVSLEERKRGGFENPSGSEFPEKYQPASGPHYTGAPNQELDRVKTSVRHNTPSSLLSEHGSHLTGSPASSVTSDSLTSLDKFNQPVQSSVHTLPETGDPCVIGVTPCPILTNVSGTSLLWGDMKRTLAFAWELHVFGSASLFILIALLAVFGMAGAFSLPHPLSNILTLSNSLLFTSGALRATLLLLDPYGTRQVLPHAALVALHNAPLQVLVWIQIILALVAVKDLNMLLLSMKLQHPWMIGCLSMLHCTVLLIADLYSSALSPALPLMLQTLSLCLGGPMCLCILIKSLSSHQTSFGSSVPQWVSSQKTERLGKRVTAVCAFIGVLCCSLQMYSLLWLHGLLGNWRRFSWGWWLVQFWARNLELAWGFSLLFLGSWIFWTPSRTHTRGDHWQGRSEASKRKEEKSLRSKVLSRLQKGLLSKSESSLEDLIPNNWDKFKMSRTGISNNAMSLYDEEPATLTSEYKHDPFSSCCSSDSQAALYWQKVGERECVLSLIEFDMRPPSPINLRRSIDNALHRGHLVAGSLFTPPPPSWTHIMGVERDGDLTTAPPAYGGYGWMLDTESLSASLDHFQAKEPAQSLSTTPDCDASIGSLAAVPQEEEKSSVMHHPDWSDDDCVTNL